MTNARAILDTAAQRAGTLPLARIAAAALGASAAFFALAMPPAILGGLVGLAGVRVEVSIADQIVFALLFAAVAASAGWLALTLSTRVTAPARPPRARPVKTPVAAKRADPAPTLRRGDAHPDAPPRRPIFAKNDLGTPFDEIVTDRRAAHAEPEAEFSAPDPAVDPEAAPAAAVPAEAPAAAAVEEAPHEPVVEPSAVAAPEPVGEASGTDVSEGPDQPQEEAAAAPEPASEQPPAAPREDDSIAALMARFEGGLGRLNGSPDPATSGKTRRGGRNPDDALRDALAALQQMAARQR